MKSFSLKYKILIAPLLAVALYKIWDHWMGQAIENNKYYENALRVNQKSHMHTLELMQEERESDGSYSTNQQGTDIEYKIHPKSKLSRSEEYKLKQAIEESYIFSTDKDNPYSVDYFLRNGLHVDSEISDGLGKPLLLYAVKHNQINVTSFLIQKGADLNQVARRYSTPLYQAVVDSNYTLMELLLVSGADVNIPFNNSITPIIKAANWCDIRSLKMLIDYGADIYKKYDQHEPAFEVAKRCTDPEFKIAWTQLLSQISHNEH